MRILLDVDGVLADFTGHLFRRIGSSVPESAVNEWDFFPALEPHLHEDARDEMLDPKFWESQPVLPGAVEGCQMLKRTGHELICVTTPSPMFGWSNVRQAWVKRHFGKLVETTICTDRKDLIWGDVLLDDKPENLRAWKKAWPDGGVLLFRQPWNKSCHEFRAMDWEAIMDSTRG